MSKGSKILLGICTFMPLFFGMMLMICYISILPDIMHTVDAGGNPSEFIHDFFVKFFTPPVIMLFALIIITKIGLMVYYIVHVVRHGARTEGEKVMWIILFILIGSIPFIVYYFVRIVPLPPKNEAPGALIN